MFSLRCVLSQSVCAIYGFLSLSAYVMNLDIYISLVTGYHVIYRQNIWNDKSKVVHLNNLFACISSSDKWMFYFQAHSKGKPNNYACSCGAWKSGDQPAHSRHLSQCQNVGFMEMCACIHLLDNMMILYHIFWHQLCKALITVAYWKKCNDPIVFKSKPNNLLAVQINKVIFCIFKAVSRQ